MRYRTFPCLALLAVGLSVSLPLVAQESPRQDKQPHYIVYSLGAPLGGTASGAAAVNDIGLIAGDSNLAGDTTEHAFLWAFGAGQDLGTLGGPNSAVLWPGLNNRGEAVGISDTSMMDPNGETWSCGAFLPASHNGYTCVGFMWNNGAMTALPTLGGNNGFATAVDDSGHAVGWAETATHDSTCTGTQVLQFLGVVWGSNGKVLEQLKPFAHDPDSAATGINDRGQVVGISGKCGTAVGDLSAIHAVLWENGKVTDLGNIGGHAWNTPMAINNRGQIVGFGDVKGDDHGNNPNFHAFLWTKEHRMQNLHTLEGDALSEALGINEAGQVVGVSFAAGFANPRAFIYENGRMTDLNTLISGDSELTLQVAQDINDEGVIVGQAIGQGSGACGASSNGCAFVAIPIR
jgi:probable HAF family extracellular repeat protein